MVSFLLLLLAAAAHYVARSMEKPETFELVSWEDFSSLGGPPYDQPILLDFYADWCEPCRDMKLTTFRDPAFVALLEKLQLRAVRIADSKENASAFRGAMEKYAVGALPSLVVIGRDGRALPAIQGVVSPDELNHRIWVAFERTGRRLFWRPIGSGVGADRPVVISFNKWFFIDSENLRDWRWSTDEQFVRWGNDYLHLVIDEADSQVAGVQLYARYGIRAIPTVVLADNEGKVLARFEGAADVAQAPAEIAQIARAAGYECPDPPARE